MPALVAAALGLGAVPALASNPAQSGPAVRPTVDLTHARVGDVVATGTRTRGGECFFPEFTQVIHMTDERASVEVRMDTTPDCRMVVRSVTSKEATTSAASPQGGELGVASHCTNWRVLEATHGRQDTSIGAYTEVTERLHFKYNCSTGVSLVASAGPDWSAWSQHFTLLSGEDHDRQASSTSTCTRLEGFKSRWRRNSDYTTHELRVLLSGCNGGYACYYEWDGTLHGSQYTRCTAISSG